LLNPFFYKIYLFHPITFLTHLQGRLLDQFVAFAAKYLTRARGLIGRDKYTKDGKEKEEKFTAEARILLGFRTSCRETEVSYYAYNY
jgi:hypothetical protein